jgi:Mce-associated membrane protein
MSERGERMEEEPMPTEKPVHDRRTRPLRTGRRRVVHRRADWAALDRGGVATAEPVDTEPIGVEPVDAGRVETEPVDLKSTTGAEPIDAEAVEEATVAGEADTAERDAGAGASGEPDADEPDADEPDADEPDADDVAPRKRQRRVRRTVRAKRTPAPAHRRWSVPTVALLVALAAALVTAGVYGHRWYDRRQLDTAHQQALTAARQTTVNFVSISASTVDTDLQRIVAGATGDFRDEFTRGMPQVRAAVVENNVESRGTVLRAGLVSGDLDSAVVLVAVDATVKNVRAPDGRRSHYRIQVDMSRDKRSGKWIVAKLQFVG